jgi:ethanolamine ammonia-lyase small subunit
VVDGLSSKAVRQNAALFINVLFNDIENTPELAKLRFAPLSIVEEGGDAIGDEIGELLNAEMVIVLIGKPRGLSSQDSLGLYLFWYPTIGLSNAQRNCISNIRPAGLVYEHASQKTLYLIQESRRLKLSGVNLKDRSKEK